MNQMKANGAMLAAVFAAGIFASCVTTMESGVYTYDYERVESSVDLQEMYRAYGIEGGQSIEKKATGAAVLVEGRRFTDPETGLLLELGADGTVSSPENATIQGSYKKDGSLSFFGFYEENGQTFQLSVKGMLLRSDSGDRAGSEFDGEYHATDSGTGRSQIVTVSDGLYIWKYADAQDGDFEPWPTVVLPDGTFRSGFELTTHASMGNFSEQTFFTKNMTEGKLRDGGGIRIKTITVTNGTGVAGEQTPITYEGVRAVSEDRISSAEKIRSTLSGAGNRKSSAARAFKEVPAPEWYSERLFVEDGKFVSCGMKQGGDKETALKIAESIALGKIASYRALAVSSETTGKTKATETSNERHLYETVSTVAQQQIPYKVTARFYNEEHKVAFVQIEGGVL
ncbi:MAG: hypothetical protein HDR39_02220 [Treponema sp.]|nr:hypothetical protein [Treponema sp.]